MGQNRTPECERIDSILRDMFPDRYESECVQDTYTEDWPAHVREVMEERPVEDKPAL
jgi:hypothetical protein